MHIDASQIVLPLSGRHIQWRPETRDWRILSPINPEGPWHTWNGGPDAGVSLDCDTGPALTDERWWLIYGEASDDTETIIITLADGHTPPVHRIGPLYAAEWRSIPMAATVQSPATTHVLDLHRLAQHHTSH